MHSNRSGKFCSACPIRRFGLCPALIKALSEQLDSFSSQQFELPAKRYLYRQGDLNEEGYILKSGWILLTRLTSKGARQVLRSILPGDFIEFQPELNGPHIHSAVALTDCVVCTVPNLTALCRSQPEITLRLAWMGACDTTLMEIYLANIAQSSALERIAFMALELFLRLKLRGLNKGYTIPFPLLQEDIADTLGLSIIHVSRTLKNLKKDGILQVEKHELTILDYDRFYGMVGSQLEPLAACEISESDFD